FKTLPPVEILSGWAEAVKTAYIDNADMTETMLAADPLDILEERMERFVTYCRDTKTRIVTTDPTEQGLRKILNFGHTAGHALETLMLERATPVPHGIAVAHGILIALILSFDILALPQHHITRYASWLKQNYPVIPISCKDYDRICEIMTHDKKNSSRDFANFVLLREIGTPKYDIPVTPAQLKAALDLYQTLI
ncbi:MAG: 3-dehydroquinate synthase, partial [Muribaculaceae bacterium]|nr:3-dehydroquinate synthase [Muribaculaceae bacterium]